MSCCSSNTMSRMCVSIKTESIRCDDEDVNTDLEDMPTMENCHSVMRWPFPSKLQNFSWWHIGSAILVPTIGIISKIMTDCLNTFRVHNRDVLIDAIDNRPKGTPLLTICNHHSCLDDPMLWGILDWRHILSSKVMRWTAAAHDICFTNDWHSQFFALGKTFPVIRGAGVYQKGMDFCIERLNAGSWVHVFPEGKVNMAKAEFLRLKWGIGRLIAECATSPIVLPFWHLGMDEVLPNVEPYRPKIGKTVTVLIGSPFDCTSLREKLWQEKKTAEEQRKIITDHVQDELFRLKAQAEMLHFGTNLSK